MNNVAETYHSADAKRIFKGIFMPHTLLNKSDEEKAKEARKSQMLQGATKDAQLDAVKAKKRKQTIMLVIGGIIVLGLGVGLCFAFKKQLTLYFTNYITYIMRNNNNGWNDAVGDTGISN